MTRNVEYILSLRDKFTNNLTKANRAVEMMDRNTSRLRNTITQLLPVIGMLGAIRGAGAILKLGTDMEQTNLSFEVMLGSAEKAQKLLAKVKDFSVKTPFLFTDVVENTKQLLAYGFSEEKVLSAMKLIGNVASGLKIPFGDMAYLYGTLRAQGRAYAIDLRQFAMRGIPIYEELAKVLGVDVTKVQKLTAEGKIGFAQVEQAFVNMSSAGGKFYNLMDRQALTTAGKWSNLRDKLTLLAIDYGTKYLPQLNKLIDSGMRLSQWLTDNANKVLKVINVVLKAAKLYLMYKASVMGVILAVKTATVVHTAYRIAMLAYNRGIVSATRVTQAFNTAMKLNLVAIGITALAAIIMKLRSVREEADKTKETVDKFAVTQNKINDIIEDVKYPFGNWAGNYSTAELQSTIDYLQEIHDRTKDVGFQTKIVNQKTGEYLAISNKAYKNTIAGQLDVLQKELNKRGIAMSPGGVQNSQETNITSAAPKIVNINIQNLIGTQKIETTTLREGTALIKKLVVEALLDGLNDTQISRAS